jgi:hypothetical protein
LVHLVSAEYATNNRNISGRLFGERTLMATIRSTGPGLKPALASIVAKATNAHEVRAGFLEGSTYPNGTSVPMVAAVQEFGAPKRGIPPRPFMRATFAAHSAEWLTVAKAALVENGYDAAVTLKQMGELISAQIKEQIIATTSPPLSPITVMLRGMRSNNPSLVVTGKTVGIAAARVAAGKTNYGASKKPLIDTDVMKSAVDFEVV